MEIKKWKVEKAKEKSYVKNGMTFFTTDGECYLKLGNKCIKIELSNLVHPVLFSEFKDEDIESIFGCSGEIVSKKIYLEE